MTNQELRSLLERAEKLGGPFAIQVVAGDLWINWADSCRVQTMDLKVSDETVDVLVGVLERDLTRRELDLESRYEQREKHPWSFMVLSPPGAEEARIASAEGDTKIEAILKAWLSAAEAESWE